MKALFPRDNFGEFSVINAREVSQLLPNLEVLKTTARAATTAATATAVSKRTVIARK